MSQGGLKAAILSDVIQGLAMIGVSMVIIVQGTIGVNGPANVLNVTSERGRLDFFKYVNNPTLWQHCGLALARIILISLQIYRDTSESRSEFSLLPILMPELHNY